MTMFVKMLAAFIELINWVKKILGFPMDEEETAA